MVQRAWLGVERSNSGFGVEGLWFSFLGGRVYGAGFGFMVQDFWVYGAWFGVQGAGFGV
jgi:hypothetical protein